MHKHVFFIWREPVKWSFCNISVYIVLYLFALILSLSVGSSSEGVWISVCGDTAVCLWWPCPALLRPSYPRSLLFPVSKFVCLKAFSTDFTFFILFIEPKLIFFLYLTRFKSKRMDKVKWGEETVKTVNLYLYLSYWITVCWLCTYSNMLVTIVTLSLL